MYKKQNPGGWVGGGVGGSVQIANLCQSAPSIIKYFQNNFYACLPYLKLES